MKIILYAIPGFVVLILVEWLYGLLRGRNTYRLADTIMSISLGSISRLRGLVFLGIGSFFYARAAGDSHLFDLPDQGLAIWLFALVAYDFSYYWFHRISHEVNFFWAAHVVHHQSEDYNLGTALRQSGSGLFGFVFYLPWLYIGIPPEILFASGAINLVYQFWVHTEHVPKLGPVEYVFVTASNHRVHHAQNSIYIDRNYGGIFIIWDRIFGSFQEELTEEPCIYGIRKSLKSYNPLWANFHVYWSILLDSWRATRWSDKIRIWFSNPGWRPEGLDFKYPIERLPLEAFNKYDPKSTSSAKAYAFLQFFATTLAATGLMIVANDWPIGHLLVTTGFLIFSFYVQSTWTEARVFDNALEWFKLGLALLLLAWLPLGITAVLVLAGYLAASLLIMTWLTVRRKAVFPDTSPFTK
jgi:alkylglycerol monooxygenase